MDNNSSSPSTMSSTFTKDFLASVVVFLVALPLCMGIAIACGVPPALGIITGIVGGVVVGSISGCPLQVSGPAAGLVVVVADLIKEHGIEKLGLIIFMAGVMQLVAGCLRLAQWFRAVTPAIINGMLTGIGILIFASQFHVMVDDVPKGSGINNLLSIPMAVYKGIMPNTDTSHEEAAIIGVCTILVLILWDKFVPKKLKIIPGSLIAVGLSAIVAAIFNFPVHYVSLPNNLVESIRMPHMNDLLAAFTNKDLIESAILVAVIATAETLLTASAVDKMHRGPRTNYDRELGAQGVGNIICGVLGALPMTGVMVRSGVNVAAGAQTRASAIMHGFWLLLCVALLPHVVRLVPVSSLAALLVFTGWKLANFKAVKELAKYGRSEVVIWAITVVTIISVDLLTGVLAGLGLAVAKLLYQFSHLEISVVDDAKDNRTYLKLSGAATFLSLPKFATALESVRTDSELHIDLERLDYIDHACLDLLMTWDKQHQATGGTVVIDWSTLGAMFRDRRRRPRSDSGRHGETSSETHLKLEESSAS